MFYDGGEGVFRGSGSSGGVSGGSRRGGVLLTIVNFATIIVLIKVVNFFALRRGSSAVRNRMRMSRCEMSYGLPNHVMRLEIGRNSCIRINSALTVLRIPRVGSRRRVLRTAGTTTRTVGSLASTNTHGRRVRNTFRLIRRTRTTTAVTGGACSHVRGLCGSNIVDNRGHSRTFTTCGTARTRVTTTGDRCRVTGGNTHRRRGHVTTGGARTSGDTMSMIGGLLGRAIRITRYRNRIDGICPGMNRLINLNSPVVDVSVVDSV